MKTQIRKEIRYYQKRVPNEARIAKLNLSSTPKTTQIHMSCDNEESVEKTDPKSSDLEEMLSKCDKSENDSKKSSEAERLMSRPGPKAANQYSSA